MRGGSRPHMVAPMSNVNSEARQSSAPGLRALAFAIVYDPVLWVGERLGMRAHRQDPLQHARRRAVDLGSGTGLNLAHDPDDLDELILTGPEALMRARPERKLGRSRRSARVLGAAAERPPFNDGSVDTVVSTLVLCTVDAPHVARQKIARVLRPDGQLLFVEHLRSESARLASWRDRLVTPWQRFAEGCRCNRATVELIKACEVEVDQLGTASWRGTPPIVRPLVVGRARPKPQAQ